MKLKPGPTRRVRATNTRGAAFCGLGAFVGIGKTQRAHVYTAATLPVGPDDYKKIDPEKLARELEVDMCAVNHGRFWMMDEVEYAGGDTRRLSRRQDELGRRHDRCRNDRPVPERLRAFVDPAQHQLDLSRGQAGAPAARAERHGLGPAGIHEGRRSEPHPRQSSHGGRQAEEPAERLEVRDQGAHREPIARYGSRRRMGGHHSRRSAATPIRAAATARTPAPTTSRDSQARLQQGWQAGASPGCFFVAAFVRDPRQTRPIVATE